MAATKELDPIEERHKAEQQQLIDNRRLRFVELLGAECKYINALVIDQSISPWDVKKLLENNCPPELIPPILLGVDA